MLPVMIWNVAAFRPDRAPETILLLHDLASFATFVPFSVATLEAWVIGAAILSHRGTEPNFPRWLGYALVLPWYFLMGIYIIKIEKTRSKAVAG